ncbi:MULTISPECIES: DUF3883 domain-containing protein [unclassified Mesorhizobium]|uniref:DUF3883 domain-containing protein n=1 Tax=unclassified Mesorhizobium TaxID=325217 RepID=UPI000F759D20|nr:MULTISPECIES: DUF3883 domain-containing protein [unclassified Mesorhizobium]AZO65123.1 DUF3883 domain-containing protein [Mesorhizobium sp. M6A.T.Cr.TU.016.01.1.1]RWP51349.1 MAG: DUF3883 domain-containing protein [Mesorhizobium sp.]RWQ82711.1 MAG: DUF3883 domain-containing protein [Mesorhizobium sp.]
MPEAPAGSDWTNRQIELIVADYFDMLSQELAGRPFVKAQRNAQLQELTGRSRGSIEFKHQNISAVLYRLGMPWIAGYKPMANFQHALVDGVERHIARNPALFESPISALSAPGLHEPQPLFFEAPPVAAFGTVPPALERIVRKFDPALRDARNRLLGKSGEERVFFAEQSGLRTAGRDDLARKVRWVSVEDGDGAGYDIRSFDPAGRERLIEVKTTTGHKRTPFLLSENERAFSEERPDAFRLVRLFDFVRQPRAFELTPPLDRSVLLKAATWRAEF